MSTAQSTGDPQAARGLRALVVRPEGTAEVVDLGTSPVRAAHRIHEIIGGDLEGLTVPDANWCAYLNEHGEREGSAYNVVADQLCRYLGWHWRVGDHFKGTGVFLGRAGVDEVDVPEVVLTVARSMGVEIAEPERSR